MDGNDAARKIGKADLFKSRFGHPAGQGLLVREFADAFNQVLIALLVISDELADFRDNVIGKRVISF